MNNNYFAVSNTVSNYKNAAFHNEHPYENWLEQAVSLVGAVAGIILMLGSIAFNSVGGFVAGIIIALALVLYTQISNARFIKFLRKNFIYLIWGNKIEEKTIKDKSECRTKLTAYSDDIKYMKSNGKELAAIAEEAEKIIAFKL